MRMIFDLHNDLLTCGPKRGAWGAGHPDIPRRVILALWTTRMRADVKTLGAIIRRAQARYNAVTAKLMFAVEDLGFLNSTNGETNGDGGVCCFTAH